jgi:hypothetical protein
MPMVKVTVGVAATVDGGFGVAVTVVVTGAAVATGVDVPGTTTGVFVAVGPAWVGVAWTTVAIAVAGVPLGVGPGAGGRIMGITYGSATYKHNKRSRTRTSTSKIVRKILVLPERLVFVLIGSISRRCSRINPRLAAWNWAHT